MLNTFNTLYIFSIATANDNSAFNYGGCYNRDNDTEKNCQLYATSWPDNRVYGSHE